MTRAANHARLRRLGTAGIFPFRGFGLFTLRTRNYYTKSDEKSKSGVGGTEKLSQCGQGIDHSDIGVAQENDKLGIWRIVRTGHLRTNFQTGVGICLDYQNPDRLPP